MDSISWAGIGFVITAAIGLIITLHHVDKNYGMFADLIGTLFAIPFLIIIAIGVYMIPAGISYHRTQVKAQVNMALVAKHLGVDKSRISRKGSSTNTFTIQVKPGVSIVCTVKSGTVTCPEGF